MAQSTLASAVALPDDVDQTSSTNGLKRRQSDILEREEEQENKRQRVSPGKNSPSQSRDDADEKEPARDERMEEQPADSRGAHRKTGVADEKQRSRRLFGALLGNLNQPGDRTSKRRQEIESRRKAELQRQDDDRVEDKQRRQERIAEHRRKSQVKVDEQNMRIRHSNMLNAANFLQTTSEPKLYYRPWDLRPDEESRVEQQIAEAQAQVDSELQDFERESKHMPNEGEMNGATTTNPDNNDQSDPIKEVEPPADSVTADENMTDIEHQAKSANLEEPKPAEVPDSDPTNSDPHDPAHTPDGGQTESTDPPKEHVEETEEDVDHVVDGDEDTVIY